MFNYVLIYEDYPIISQTILIKYLPSILQVVPRMFTIDFLLAQKLLCISNFGTKKVRWCLKNESKLIVSRLPRVYRKTD